MKKAKLFGAIALALATSQAHAVLFDPDGAGGLPAMNIGGIDWGPNTFLAQGAVTAISNFSPGCTATCTFTVYTQANVVGFTAPGGAVLPNPAGLNSTFEITMVAAFTEKVTGIAVIGGQTVASFQTAATPTNVEFYYDNNLPATKSDPLTGFGYNDGTLILNGTTTTVANGKFGVDLDPITGLPIITSLDQSPGGDQYTGQNTVSGDGSTGNLTIGGLTTDSAFFVDPLAALGYRFTNISQNLPFTTVHPGDCFTTVDRTAGQVGTGGFTSTCDAVHVNGLYSANQTVPAGAIAPSTGNPNGLVGQGPDFVSQTDFNSSLIAAVPEPTSLALLGLGLAAMGFRTRRPKM